MFDLPTRSFTFLPAFLRAPPRVISRVTRVDGAPRGRHTLWSGLHAALVHGLAVLGRGCPRPLRETRPRGRARMQARGRVPPRQPQPVCMRSWVSNGRGRRGKPMVTSTVQHSGMRRLVQERRGRRTEYAISHARLTRPARLLQRRACF